MSKSPSKEQKRIWKLDRVAKAIEDVLAEHQPMSGVRDGRLHCVCGWHGGELQTPVLSLAVREGERRTHIAVKVALALDTAEALA